MNMVNFKFLLITLTIVSISFLISGCSDDKTITNGGLQLVATNQSFALLALDIDERNDATKIADVVKEYNPQIVVLENATWSYSQSIDLATEVSYKNAMAGQRRQGYFSAAQNDGNVKKGVGFFVTNTFGGTKKIVLDNSLVLHVMNYTLGNSKIVTIISCSFDKKSSELALKQARALVNYANKIDSYTLISANISNANNEVVEVLKGAYTQSCDIDDLKNSDNKSQYIFTSKSNLWGIKYGAVIKNDNVSKSEGLLLRIGLTE